jgi:hypothetical protein
MCLSPTSVTEFTMIATRYLIVSFSDRGRVAYDLLDTMNRMEHFQALGTLTMDGAEYNLNLIRRLRYNEVQVSNCVFHAMMGTETGTYGHQMWFRRHGCEVDMTFYEEQEANEAAIVDAAEAIEGAHILWDAMRAINNVIALPDEVVPDEVTEVTVGSSQETAIDLTEAGLIEHDGAIQAWPRMTEEQEDQLMNDTMGEWSVLDDEWNE